MNEVLNQYFLENLDHGSREQDLQGEFKTRLQVPVH
jgi:hypothetical protein